MTLSYLTLLDIHAKIPGCDGVPYEKPTSPLKTGAWFWDVDDGTPEGKIPSYQFQWGNFDITQRTKTQTKTSIFKDLTMNNSASLKKQVSSRISAINELNESVFQKDSGGESVYFDFSYVYSEDLALVYSLKELGRDVDDIVGQSVIYFAGENSAEYVQGVILSDGKTLKTDDGKRIVLPETSDNLHLKSSFDFIGYYLEQLSGIGIGADFLFSTDLEGEYGPDALDWTENAMRKAARYNVYAEKEGLTKYNFFNIDTEPGSKVNLQSDYLEINDKITGLFGPGTDFDWGIAAYVNQQQMDGPTPQKPFAGLVAENAESMIFGTYRPTPQAQCAQFDTLINPSKQGFAKNSVWTMAWEASKTPVGVKKPPSPLIDEKSVMNMRKMADIAIAQAGASPLPMMIDGNPEVALSSFLPIYVQLVHGQGVF